MPESLAPRDRMLFISAFLITVALVLLINFLGLLEAANWHTYDLFFRIRGSREPPRNIIIAEIDERTLSALGKWPIPRRHYADLLDRLELAEVVGLDIILAEPSEDDERLANSIRKFGKVVLAAYLDPHGQIIHPTKTLSAGKTGHVHVEMDTDGIVRNIYHGFGLNGSWLQSFASRIFEFQSTPPGLSADGTAFCAPGIAQSDPMAVNYYGRSGTFRRVPFHDILNGKLPPESFQGMTILVGVTAQGIEAEFVTPFTSDRNRMPGVEFHANVLGNLLDNSAIKPVAAWLPYVLAILFTAVFFVLFTCYPAMRAFVLCMICLLALTTSLLVLFVHVHAWVPPGMLWASIVAPFLVCSILELKRAYRSLVQARKNWEEAFDTIDDGVFIQDRKGDFIRSNLAGRLMLGDFLLKAMQKRCIEFARQPGGRESQLPGDGKDEPARIEEWFDAAAGRYYEVKSLQRNARGKFDGLVHVVRDITGKKQAEEEQKRLGIMLIQSQKMDALGTLASGIAHDFNNILTSVFGYTELVLCGLTAEDTNIRPKLEQVLKAASRAKELIAQILTFSRRTVVKRSSMRVAPVLQQAVKLFKTGVPSSVTIVENFEVDCDVEIDPTQMHQVILNLCTNAYHALPDTGGTIRISLTNIRLEQTLYRHGQELKPGEYTNLTVTDNGCGISEEHLEKIFEPYFTTKAEGKGTGLGLAIVQAIVQEYGGVVTVDSLPGKCTSFHIYLPRTSPCAPLAAVECEGMIDSGSGLILLIEDDPQTCSLIKEMLEGFGYEVESKSNAREALDLFRTRARHFNLVITDFDMPLMSGIELAENLLEVRPDIPILLCTGYLDNSLSVRAKAAGIREVVRKPFDSKKLSRIIAATITR